MLRNDANWSSTNGAIRLLDGTDGVSVIISQA
jgi:hypothetical protein